MNDRPDTAPGGGGEAASAGPEGGPWLDERAALAVVMRLRPELSREEAEGQLLVFHYFGRTRHEEPPGPRPGPDGNGAAAAPPGDRHVPRFHYNDLARWFVQLPVPAPPPDPFFDNLRHGGSSRDLPQPVVGSPAALRHVRLAHPDSTEYERKALLWEAMRAGRVGAWWPPGSMLITTSEGGRRESWAATERFWDEALFSEPTVLRAFPPVLPAAPEPGEVGRSLPQSGEADASAGPSRNGKARETGQKAASAWATAVGSVAGWLAANGGNKTQQAELESRLIEEAEALGREMSAQTARRLASAMLDRFRDETG